MLKEKCQQQDKSGIYRFTNLANGKIYIGSSKRLERRIKDHLYQLEKKCNDSLLLQRAWDKYGFEYFDIDILEYCNEFALPDREQYYMDLYESYNPELGYNISRDTKCFSRGLKRSDETKLKMSKANKGHPSYMKSQTLETRERISESLKGRKISDETREILRSKMLGNNHGKGNMGNKLSEERKNKIRIQHSKTYPGFISPEGIIYKDVINLSQFCRNYNLPRGSMGKLSQGIWNNVHGWRRIENGT